MSEEAKRMVGGAAPAVAKSLSDDRKSTSGSAPTSSAVGKKVIIKSADMKEDMQKEAVDIAIAVTFSFFLPLKLNFSYQTQKKKKRNN